MSFDDKEFRRVILNSWVEFEHEGNFCLFICIFKIGTIETVELMFNFVEKNWEKICYQHLVTEELLKNLVSYQRKWKFCCKSRLLKK